VQLVFCSLSPYDEVLGDFSEKKGGGRTCFLKISGHLWEETLGYSALQYHLGQKSLLLKGHFGHFCAVLIGGEDSCCVEGREPVSDATHPLSTIYFFPQALEGVACLECRYLCRSTHHFWRTQFRNL
jgi:hypothetical protein